MSVVKKGKLLTCSLPGCSKTFYRPPSQIGKHNYCCMEHRDMDKTFHGDRVKQIDMSKHKNGYHTPCAECGKLKYVTEYKLATKNRKTSAEIRTHLIPSRITQL